MGAILIESSLFIFIVNTVIAIVKNVKGLDIKNGSTEYEKRVFR